MLLLYLFWLRTQRGNKQPKCCHYCVIWLSQLFKHNWTTQLQLDYGWNGVKKNVYNLSVVGCLSLFPICWLLFVLCVHIQFTTYTQQPQQSQRTTFIPSIFFSLSLSFPRFHPTIKYHMLFQWTIHNNRLFIAFVLFPRFTRQKNECRMKHFQVTFLFFD